MDVAIIDQSTGVVVSVIDLSSIDDYDPGPGLLAVVCEGEVAYAGCTWSDTDGFAAPVRPPLTQVELVAYAADKRWRVETGGIAIGGMPVATDDRSKMMIMGARVKANDNPDFTTKWKSASGMFVVLDGAAIIAISDAVLSHVDTCFEVEATVLAEIAAGTITTIEQIDAAGWPMQQ
jgi:hypothetical protein